MLYSMYYRAIINPKLFVKFLNPRICFDDFER